MIFFKIDEETAREYRMPNIVQKSVLLALICIQSICTLEHLDLKTHP